MIVCVFILHEIPIVWQKKPLKYLLEYNSNKPFSSFSAKHFCPFLMIFQIGASFSYTFFQDIPIPLISIYIYIIIIIVLMYVIILQKNLIGGFGTALTTHCYSGRH